MKREEINIDYLERVLRAQVYNVAEETPLEMAPRLSARVKNRIYLKREDMQEVFSFKIRGAYNKIANLDEEVRRRGVICASAGNHAQGVALAARKLGCRAVIVMPEPTPEIKVMAVEQLGGEVVLCGDTFDEAHEHAREVCERQGLAFVHPFDDPDVIAGQGTIGMEILHQHRFSQGGLEAIFIPVGGGGLAAGVAAYVKRLRPEIKIIGVETTTSDAMRRSLERGERIRLEQVGLFADGTAVRMVGEETFRVCRQYLDEVVLVNNDAICAAIKDVFEDTRSILEPSGAMAVAGAKLYARKHSYEGKNLVAITSGANVNFDRLQFVAERAKFGEQREAVFGVTLPERPGSYRDFLKLLGKRSITEFNYRYCGVDEAHIFVGVQVMNREEAHRLALELTTKGYATLDLTDDEMAKNHLRHLAGGHMPVVATSGIKEVLFRCEFASSPGALLRFVDTISVGWNISLFHYRNHGSDNCRVLLGLQIAPAEIAAFKELLKSGGFTFWDESNNPAYKIFLG